MALSTKILITEADRLVARAEGRVQRHRRAEDTGAIPERAEQELKRLRLYRAILTSSEAAHALMPEYIAALGFFAPKDAKGNGEPI
jgi:hypothetical protein